jgi:hypothetical protein
MPSRGKSQIKLEYHPLGVVALMREEPVKQQFEVFRRDVPRFLGRDLRYCV